MSNEINDTDFSGLTPEEPENGEELDLVDFVEPESDWDESDSPEEDDLPPKTKRSVKLPKLNIRLPSLDAIELTESQLRAVWTGEIAFSLIAGFAALIIALAG